MSVEGVIGIPHKDGERAYVQWCRQRAQPGDSP